MTLKADGEQTHGVVSVLEAEEPPGFGPPIHILDDSALRRADVDDEELADIAQAHAMAIVWPPSERYL